MKEMRQLVFHWMRSYPGLWLSPIGLLVFGGWMWSQPNSSLQPARSEEAAVEAIAADSADSAENSTPTADAAPAEPSRAVLITRAADFEPSAPWDYQTRPAEEREAASSASAPEPSAPTETVASAAANAAANPPSAAATGKTEAQLAANPDAIAAAPPTDAPTGGPSEAEIAAAQAEQESLEQQLAAASAAQQAAPIAAPAPNIVNGGNPAVDQAIVMQVAIAEGDVNLSMGVSDGGVLYVPNGQALAQLTAGRHSLACDGQNLILNGEQSLPSTVMMAPIEGGVNYVRDRSYRGHMQFFCQGSTVLAVNHIDMLHYLYSVVGSEVSPSWPLASLKAQSVAARSYALTYYFRPAKEHFHIGDSESYQVYKGIQSEDSRVMNAVHETAGEFISYGGGIVESLYAASDDIVMEAFNGGGMSQLGARDLSEQGYNYLQILGYYYPETSLGRLALETAD